MRRSPARSRRATTPSTSTPELVNTDPYGDGWLVELTVTDASALETLLDADAYQKILDPQ